MKKAFLTTCLLRAAMTLLVALLGSTQGALAKDFITDVMVIGNNNETAFNNLQSGYEEQGWTAINKDLNAGCGSGTDFIHLLYKKQSSPGSSGTFITGFYIKTGSNSPESLTHEGRTYHLLPCDGSTNFVNSQGDLNRGAGGDYIHLYYTTDPLPNNHAVTDITFNSTQSGAVGKNGGTTGYDLNSGAGGNYVYMHVTTSNNVETLTSESTDVLLCEGNVLTGTGGKKTKVTIAAGATVTLSGVDITDFPQAASTQWSGITCLGDAVIILAEGTKNKVNGGRFCSSIFVPEGNTLTIRGNGSLDAIGGLYGAGIGSSIQKSCGNIVIEGGNITAEGGSHSAGIGSGYYESSCGDITINGGNITATGGERSAGIGCGYHDSSCGDITFGVGIIRVSATKGYDAKTAIGPSYNGSCGTITIAPNLIDVTADKTRTLWPGLVLHNNADNTDYISTNADGKKHDVQLRGRTLYCDGTWNTLCLPFDLDDFTGTPLEGFIAIELDTETARNGYVTGLDPMTITYHLNFKPATSIEAGKPYIVRRSTASETGTLTNPLFYDMTIKNVTPTAVTSTDRTVTFKGSFSPVTLGANDHAKLFLDAINTLHHPNAVITVGSCHASFLMEISNKGDVNSDGGLSVGDVAAMVNYVMGTPNDHFVAANADLNGDGDINVTDVTLLVGMILDKSQNLNIEVYTGDFPITYKGGGNGEAN